MPNQKNIEKVEKLKEMIEKSKSLVFARYHGLDANKINELRASIKAAGGEMTVAKNTLVKIALDEQKLSSKELESELEGPVATIFSYEDAIAPLKAIAEFAKKFELPEIKAGIIDGVFTTAEKMKILSELPSREELLARLVGSFKSPLSGITNVLSGSQRKLIYAFSAIAEKKEE